MPYKAFILAAGEGRRMLPLTESCPKPLLKVRGKCLIEYHIERLVKAGVRDIIINVSYLGQQIQERLQNGAQFGAKISYSRETQPLETGGGLFKALPLIGDDPFILVNGDVWTDLDFGAALARKDISTCVANGGGFLFLVDNPEHHPAGDFGLSAQANGASPALINHTQQWTFSGISLLSPAIIRNYPRLRERFPLKELFDFAIENNKLMGEKFTGEWRDIGTPERLNQLRNSLVEER